MFEILNSIKLNREYSDCYLIYTRKSTDDTENQKNSIDYQVAEGLKVSGRDGLKIAPLSLEGFCDAGIIREHHSGFKQDEDFTVLADGMVKQKVARPKFLLLAELLKQRQFKGVICLCWDRFSRNEFDDGIIKKLLNAGVDIRFVQTTYDKSSSGALHMDIDGAFSRHYSRVISEKVRNTTNKLRSEGKCTYRSPIGYLDQGSDNKPFDPERAPVVKEIFERYATGEWGFSSLAAWARIQGLTTKAFRTQRTKIQKLTGVELETIPKISRAVTEKTIENILSNPFYIGKTIHREAWIDSTAHQPLIDAQLFYKVQAMLKKKTVSMHHPELSFFIYRDLIRCGGCGRGYSPYLQKGKVYYRCKCKPDCSNPIKNIPEKFIAEKVQGFMNTISFSDDELQEMEITAKGELNKVSEKRNKELAELYRLHNKALADLDYLSKEKLSLLRNQVMTIEQIRNEEVRLCDIIADTENRISTNSESTQAMLSYIIAFSELVKNAASYFESALDSEKREIAIQIFSELIVNGKNLNYVAKQGFADLLMRFDGENLKLGSPNYVFLELSNLYASIKSSSLRLQTFLASAKNIPP